MNSLVSNQKTQNPEQDSLRKKLIELGADDVRFVSINAPRLREERDEIVELLPRARTLVSFCVRMNPEALRAPPRSVANLEFHHVNDSTDDIAHRIAKYLKSLGHRAVHPGAGFPMEMHRFPGKIWTISHKLVAEASGLGKMGIHRNVIHPQFGNFIFLGTVVTDLELDAPETPLDYSPCMSCKLCVAACPTGAIGKDGSFNFSACYTHNYREFMGGFSDLMETVVESKNRLDFRDRVPDTESTSWWQSLSYGANYKAAYCLAVCPAGEDVIAPFRESRKEFVSEVVRPFQIKEETIYVTENSDAADIVKKRFPNKSLKVVGNSLRPTSIPGLLKGMPLTFQPGKAKKTDVRIHFRFKRRKEFTTEATVHINSGKLSIEPGCVGESHTRVTAQEDAWLGFLRQEKNLLWQLFTGRIRVRGSIAKLSEFGKCFAA